jgi:hypothetical protein
MVAGSTWYANTFIFPWLGAVRSNVSALSQLTNLAPAQERVRVSLLRAGQTILNQVEAGTSVSSEDAKNWLALTKAFSIRIATAAPAPAATIGSTADQGQNTPDDSLTSGGQTLMTAATQAIHDAAAALEDELVNTLPWGWIALGLAAIFILPPMLSGGGDTRSYRRR